MANGNDLSRILQQQGSSGLQLSPARQSQVELARGLASQSMSGAPVRGGPVEALSRVGQAFFARQMLDEAQQERESRQQRLAETLQGVVQAGQPQPSPIQEQGGVGAVGALALTQDPQARVPQTENTPQERRQAVLSRLLQNPDTAPAAGQIALSQALQGPQSQTRTVSGEQANRMFGTQLNPGAAVTVEGNQETGFSVADVQEPSQSGRVRTLSSEQKQQLGFPEDSVVQQKPDGSLSVKYKPSGRGSAQREREIAAITEDLQGQVDNPEQKATRLVDGRARIDVSQDGRRATLVDEVEALAGNEDAAVTELQIRQPEVPEQPEIEPANTLFGMADQATGPQATIRSVTARIPFTNVSEEERGAISARRAFDLTENEMARALVNNPRFPVREREAVINAVNISPSFFDNPDAMKARLGASRDFLQSRLEQARRDAQDESLPQETREAQSANAAAMERALSRIGQPAEETASTVGQIAGLDQDSARVVIDDMPRPQLQSMVQNASDDELRKLPDALSTRIAERLRDGDS